MENFDENHDASYTGSTRKRVIKKCEALKKASQDNGNYLETANGGITQDDLYTNERNLICYFFNVSPADDGTLDGN